MGWRIGACHCPTVRRRILTDFGIASVRLAGMRCLITRSFVLGRSVPTPNPCALRRTRSSSSEKVRCACHDPHKHRTIHMDFVSIPTCPSFRCLDDDKVTSTLPLASNRYPHETESYSLRQVGHNTLYYCRPETTIKYTPSCLSRRLPH